MDKPVESQLNNNEANDADGLWSSCAESIRAQVSDAVWHTTFSGARAAAFDGGELVIVVPNGLQKERIEGRYLGLVKHAITESRSNATVRVEIDTDWTEAAFDIPSADLTAPPEHIPMSEALPEARNELNEKFTFEHFVIGPSNRFAHAAAFSVAETPAASYNPLFIHGDSGLGKTHLLRGIAHYIGSHYSHYKVRYVSTETFLNEFVQAIRTNTQPEFKRRYRTNDVLLIDDIQFMEGKEGLQEEFFHTFNELHQNNKQIVLSSDRTPDAMPTLEERLRNRFKWGLITDIQRPDLETRLAILRKKAESRTIQIPGDVFTFIAENITQSIRELEGALIKVTAYASLTEQRLDMRLASYVLTDLINNSQKPPVTATRIIELTGEMFGFEVDQITGGSRRRPLVDARQVAMYVARNMTDLSFPDIGRAFGDRDHTTVMHAVRKIEARMGERQQIFDKVTELQRRLNKPP
ncbi:MAG: chromosomal replication initiator protein DnaA [Acidimicrobiaceae bacterium]|nr:chromosomal replication initiator protein DnaA [Acidimicrobiaceae bacterium]